MPVPAIRADTIDSTPECVDVVVDSKNTDAKNKDAQDFDGVCDVNQAAEARTTQTEVQPCKGVEGPLSIWTRKTCGLPLSAFVFGFMNGTIHRTQYGFFLGYLGLEPYVLLSVQSMVRFPEVLLLLMGIMSDTFPIFGKHRKPYMLIGWSMCGLGLLLVALWPLPEPYHCIGPDGNFDYLKPPCNPAAHESKNFYVACAFLCSTALTLACVAGDGLVICYSQMEPVETRGRIRAQIIMMVTGGQLVANLVVALFMNSKEYLGTFDWGIGYDGIAILALGLVALTFVVIVFFTHEPECIRFHRTGSTIHSTLKESWTLMKSGAFMGCLAFGFVVHMMVCINTTAGPLVKSRWAEVKNLQAQLCHMASSIAEIFGVWLIQKYLLQTSWRRMFFSACVGAVTCDAIPAFLTVFGIVRNQYFYLGEEIVAALPMAAIKLVSGLILIEMAEPGREGLCIGLMGTVTQASGPFGTAISNQLFALFHPSLSDEKNYEHDTDEFRRIVALSYVVSYGTTLASFFLVYLIPNQKEEAHQRKKDWGHKTSFGVLVLLFPSICCCYSFVVLVLANMESTNCLRFVGGQGC